MNSCIIYFDGASRGNPGHSGVGVIVFDKSNNRVCAEISKYIGKASNNVAEYSALLIGLKWAIDNKCNNVTMYSDSQLVVKQINKEYKVRNKELISLYNHAQQYIDNIDQFQIHHIKRDKNKRADRLANYALQ